MQYVVHFAESQKLDENFCGNVCIDICEWTDKPSEPEQQSEGKKNIGPSKDK